MMYNRYFPRNTAYERVCKEPSGTAQETRSFRSETVSPPPPPPSKGTLPLDGITGRLGGLFKNLHLEKLDSGDILLVLILLFLFLESDDNLELVIALGLLLAFGLFGSDSKEQD